MQIIANLKDKHITFCLNIILVAEAIKVYHISACIYDLHQFFLAGKRPQPCYQSNLAILAQGFYWAGVCSRGGLREHFAALTRELSLDRGAARAACSGGSASKPESKELALNSGPGRAS